MTKYTLTDQLKTGNAMIDSQHKQLIDAINDLLEACYSGKGRAQLAKTTQFLLDYTKKHFGDEEALQRKFNYPDYINHKKLHDGFTADVKEIGDQLNKEGANVTLVGKVNNTIVGWLFNHIKKEDTKIAAFIKNTKTV